MKKNFILAVVLCLLFGFGILVPVQAQQSSSAQLKSIHLFDLPQGVTEAELSAVLKEMNTNIKRLGYKDAGYFLYKVEGEGAEKYRYFFEGVWPSAEAYQKIHEDKMYMESNKRASVIIQKIREAELYRRLKRVD
jgi:hypothetical protein